MMNELIYEAVANHLTMGTNGALMITGDWGCGKTHHVKHHVLPKIEETLQFIPVVVSVYGETDRNSIARKVLMESFDKLKGESGFSLSKITKKLKRVTEAIPALNKYVNVEKLISGSGHNLLSLLPKDKLLICFDDFERLSEEIQPDDFLGLINDLVENLGVKVLIIANESEIKNIEYKEKTVEKTVLFTPDMSRILDDLSGEYEDGEFKDYLVRNKESIHNSLKFNSTDGKDLSDLRKSLTNIRTIKFALEHFKKVFELLNPESGTEKETVDKQLINLWHFCLAVSVEYRKPKSISYHERMNIDIREASIADLDLSQIDFSDIEGEEDVELNESTYSDRFKKLYFERHAVKYVFHSQVYDLITAGIDINKVTFLEDLQKRFNVEEGVVPEGHRILNSFLHGGWWRYSNDEFKEEIVLLLSEVEGGKLLDLHSFINAGVYLTGFASILGMEKHEVTNKVKTGFSAFLNSSKVSDYMYSQYQVMKHNTDDVHIKDLVVNMDDQLQVYFDEVELGEIEEYTGLFKTDTSAFVKTFVPGNGNINLPAKSIFHKFESDIFEEAIQNWNPEGIVDLTSFLELRYLKSSFADKLLSELLFLEHLQHAISKVDLSDKTLSNHVIEKQLQPAITKCVERLNAYKGQSSEA